MLFSRDGHDVKAVTSGKEAIKLIKSEEFDLSELSRHINDAFNK